MLKNKMPRVELHCHLDGSLSKGCLEELLGRKVADEELGVSTDCRDLAQYLEKFDLPLSVLQNEAGLKRAGYDFIETVYRELIDGLEKGKKEYGVEYGVIVCAMRHHGYEENLAMIKTSREFLGNGVCGADLAGNEAAYPMSEFMELFTEVRRLGMPFTIHAGECGNVKNITDAIECGAARIGHGIAMRNDEAVMKLCADRKIGVEMCPISNLQTKAVKDMSEYPMKQFLDKNIMVTVNTDNRTVSTTTMDKELDFIQKNYGITDDEIVRMMKNAVEVSWADDAIKNRLIKMFS